MTRTILVVDDNASVRDSLRFLLERRGYGVFVADAGPAAMALAAQNRIDGAMVDVNMPGVNGLTVCRSLRAQAAEAGREISVWMITGAVTSELMKSAAEAGACGVFGKPFELSVLFQKFEERFGAPPGTTVE